MSEEIDDWMRAKLARDEGMARAEKRAGEEWRKRAVASMHQWLLDHPTFFVDDWWAESGIDEPASMRALGPVVRTALRAGWMEDSGESRPSVRSRLGRKPIWRSLIHQ